MSLQFLYAGLTSMATFYIQYAVTVYLENPFSRNPHVTCPSKIDDGVRLGSRDRVIVLPVSGVKTSLLKKWVYTCKNLDCAFHYFTAFSCEQILFTKFLIRPVLKYGQRFLVNNRWCNIFFSYRFVYPGLKLSEKKTKYELLTFLFYGIDRFFCYLCRTSS